MNYQFRIGRRHTFPLLSRVQDDVGARLLNLATLRYVYNFTSESVRSLDGTSILYPVPSESSIPTLVVLCLGSIF